MSQYENRDFDFCIKMGCEHMNECSNYSALHSDIIPWVSIGCPDININPNECEFYNLMQQYKEIDRKFKEIGK